MEWLTDQAPALSGMLGVVVGAITTFVSQWALQKSAFRRNLDAERRRNLVKATEVALERLDEFEFAEPDTQGNYDLSGPLHRAFAPLAPWVQDWPALKAERDRIVGLLVMVGGMRIRADHHHFKEWFKGELGLIRYSPAIHKPPRILLGVRDFFTDLAAEPHKEAECIESLYRLHQNWIQNVADRASEDQARGEG